MSDTLLRDQLSNFLTTAQAHMTLEEAVKDFPISHINDIFPNGTYTFWHLLEHIRRTQIDILDFIINSRYKEPHWPNDYWPSEKEKATEKDWEKTISLFEKDLKALKKIVNDPKTDLEAKVSWGDGQIILREIIMVIDHNAYHIGEFSIMRQVLNLWKK